MRLTPGLFVVLVIAAIVFFAVPIAGSSSACGEADEHFQHDLTAAAQKAYADILADDPDSACAAKGMTAVITRRCDEAAQLAMHDELLKEAETAYLGLLKVESPSDAPSAVPACAVNALPEVRRRLKVLQKADKAASSDGSTNG